MFLLPLSAASISCLPFSRLQPGVQFLLGVRGEGVWRLNFTTVSRHASLVETCSSSRYLQPASPVYLSRGFNQGCSFYSEYVEKEPGESICTTVSRHASFVETCSSSSYLQPAPPVCLSPGFNQGCSGEGAWRLNLYHGESTC